MKSVRKFTKYDYLTICDWFFRHEMPAPMHIMLPRVGFIVDNVAVGFLIQTDCLVGILDFFVTNPEASMRDRSKAMDQIISSLTFAAAANGMRSLKCDSNIRSIKRRALSRGFTAIGEVSVFIKEL